MKKNWTEDSRKDAVTSGDELKLSHGYIKRKHPNQFPAPFFSDIFNVQEILIFWHESRRTSNPTLTLSFFFGVHIGSFGDLSTTTACSNILLIKLLSQIFIPHRIRRSSKGYLWMCKYLNAPSRIHRLEISFGCFIPTRCGSNFRTHNDIIWIKC